MSAEFSLTFSGPAVDDGQMAIREFAPALLALADVMAAANSLLNPGSPEPRVTIQAEARRGSFAVDLLVNEPGLLQRAVDLLTHPNTQAIVAARELVEIATGAIYFIVKIGRRVISREVKNPDGTATMFFADGSSLVVPGEYSPLIIDNAFRHAVRDVVEPVSRDGVDEVTIGPRDDNSLKAVVTRDDLPAFNPPPEGEELESQVEYETYIRPLNIAFTEGHKWRVTDGDATFYVGIRDLDFLQRVDNGAEDFRSGDRFKVRLRQEQYRSGTALRTERTVLEVLDHLKGGRQSALEFGSDED